MSNTGIKHDKGKLRYELVKPLMLEQLAKALHGGAEKYGDENYKLVDNQRYIGALFRHVQAYRKGELVDSDSGLHPMAHVMACAAIILQKDLEEKEGFLVSLNSFCDEDLDEMEREFKAREKHVQELSEQYSGKVEDSTTEVIEDLLNEMPNWLKSTNKPYPPNESVPPEVLRGLEDEKAGIVRKIKFKIDKKKKKV